MKGLYGGHATRRYPGSGSSFGKYGGEAMKRPRFCSVQKEAVN